MSGSFERQIYDTRAYSTAVAQSTAPLARILDPIAFSRCDPCRVPEPGFIGKVGVSITHQRPLIDVESDLQNRGRLSSKDPNQAYKPTCPQCGTCMEGYPCGGGVVASCDKCQENLFHLPKCDLGTDYTRTSNPLCTAREVGVNRFQPLCLNPQDECRWLQPSEIGISYRNVVKDNHVPCVPVLIDQRPALPKGKGGVPCPKIDKSVCGVFRESLHHQGKVNRNWNDSKFA